MLLLLLLFLPLLVVALSATQTAAQLKYWTTNETSNNRNENCKTIEQFENVTNKRKNQGTILEVFVVVVPLPIACFMSVFDPPSVECWHFSAFSFFEIFFALYSC